MKTLLNDILGILAITGHPLCNPQEFSRVALDQNLESTGASALGGSNKGCVSRLLHNHYGSDCRCTAI
ncbi:MAG: hypothetical protein WAU89_16155 [Candidatus Acidiferrales bacterium]